MIQATKQFESDCLVKNLVYLILVKQLMIGVLVFIVILLIPAGARGQSEENKQGACVATCEAEFEVCTSKTGSLFSRTQEQIDVANECYVKCSRDEGDAIEACEKQKYSCWQEILDRKNPNGTWQCMYAGGIEYIRPACKAEGEISCDGPREVCIKKAGGAEKDCSKRCSALESEQVAKSSLELCREQKAACLMKDKSCQVEALVEKAPSESDLRINENAKRMNEELKSLFGDWPLVDTEAKLKVPEITGDIPYLFDNPLSTKDNRYFSFTANTKNHIIEYRGGNKITLEFPDGTTFVPESGDFIRVPVGTKIKTEMGLYQGSSQYDSVGKFGMSSLGITNLAGGSSVTLGGGSVVELVPTESGGSSNVKLNDGEIRVGTGGFGGGTDRPDLPTEIQFEGRQDVKVSWDGTDFGVSFDNESKKIIAEIYDGTIKVMVGEKTYNLSSSYGGEIRRVEIDGNREVAQQEQPKEEPKREVFVEVRSDDGRSWKWMLVMAGVVGLVMAGFLGYRKRFGTWPLEERWKPWVVKLVKVYGLIANKLKRK